MYWSILLICGYVRLLFFFTAPVPAEIYTLSLHDALPIFRGWKCRQMDRNLDRAWRNDQRACTFQRTDHSAKRDPEDRKSTRLNSSHVAISYAVFCLKKKKKKQQTMT